MLLLKKEQLLINKNNYIYLVINLKGMNKLVSKIG